MELWQEYSYPGIFFIADQRFRKYSAAWYRQLHPASGLSACKIRILMYNF